jgi:two-component system response regulator YesN
MTKIMVVDDEFIVRVGIRSIVNWEEYGYTMIAEAASGREALEKIARDRPRIVLTDLVMDNMDGFELIQTCAEQYPEISFIVLSSYNDFENVRKAMKLGVRDYIFKPTITAEEILRVLNEVRSGEDSSVQRHNRQLDNVIRENLPVIKYNLLCKCMDSSALNEQEMVSQCNTLGLRIDFSTPFCLLYISIIDFEKLLLSGEFKDVQLIKLFMENIIYEALNRSRQMEVFNYEKGNMLVFFNISSDSDVLVEPSWSHFIPAEDDVRAESKNVYEYHKLEDEFSKIREYINRYLGLSISGTLSPVITGIKKLPETIKICEDTLLQRNAAAGLVPYNGGQRNEIALAREYVLKHLDEKIGVQEIAAQVGMSENYFSHLFKKETGTNFVDYVNRVKMEMAAKLLENPGLKVADVAERLGIDNSNYFSVLFKKVMGISPQECRGKYKNNKGPSKNIED